MWQAFFFYMKKLKTIRKKIIVDTITPVSIYLKLRDQFTNTILLESSDYIAKDNSYAYICCNPIAKFYVKKNILFKEFPDNSKKETKLTSTTNILSELDDFMRTFEIDDNSVESKKYISKGLFGYMSYDSIKFFENIEVENDSYGDEIPEIFYSFYREIIVINTFNNEATLISHSGDIEKINTLEKLIKTKKTNEFSFKIEDEIKSNLKDNEYLEMVKKRYKTLF